MRLQDSKWPPLKNKQTFLTLEYVENLFVNIWVLLQDQRISYRQYLYYVNNITWKCAARNHGRRTVREEICKQWNYEQAVQNWLIYYRHIDLFH